MVAKKKNNVIIDLSIVRNTLKAFNKEIKSQRAALELGYRELQKKENVVWKLEDQVRDLVRIVELSKAVKAIKAVAA